MFYILQKRDAKQIDLNGHELEKVNFKNTFSYIYTCGICDSKVDFLINGICDSCRSENQETKRTYRDGEVLEGI